MQSLITRLWVLAALRFDEQPVRVIKEYPGMSAATAAFTETGRKAT
jgi:hypothetical protein